MEKSSRNPALLEEILKDPLAKYWEANEWNPCALREVEKGSIEYNRIETLFYQTSRGITLKKIERVENPYLLGSYLLKRKKLQQDGVVSERDFFHGTRECYVDDICTFNFDWRKSKGCKFGQGVSFTPEVSYAQHYTCDGVIILARVLVGKVITGSNLTILPPEGFDTTWNGKGTVYVKYEDDDFYPRYVIHF